MVRGERRRRSRRAFFSDGALVNDTFRALKARIRLLYSLEFPQEAGVLSFMQFAQARSRVHRLLRRADWRREPTAELLASVARAEALSR